MEIEWRIIKRWATGKASPQEEREVEKWGKASKRNRTFLKNARRYYEAEGIVEDPSPAETERAWKKLDPRRRARIRRLERIGAIAAGILIVWNILPYRESLRPEETEPTGPQQATVNLITADGNRYELNEEICIDSLLTGNNSHSERNRPTTQQQQTERYNEIIVPRCGYYRLTLPDGSHVHLNAESTLRFPEKFGQERQVYLTGEAYFEVKRDTLRPFRVAYGTTRLQVLGTRFNVKAYPENPSYTTLVSGSVRVEYENRTLLMHPGEQYEMSSQGIFLHHPDLMTVLAWKNNEFIFKNTPLEEIMGELVRWYNMEVEYETEELKKMPFYLYVDRNGSLPDILKKIALTNRINYTIDGNKIILEKRYR